MFTLFLLMLVSIVAIHLPAPPCLTYTLPCSSKIKLQKYKKHHYASQSLNGTTTVANITFASGTGGSLFFNVVAAFSYSGAKRLQ